MEADIGPHVIPVTLLSELSELARRILASFFEPNVALLGHANGLGEVPYRTPAPLPLQTNPPRRVPAVKPVTSKPPFQGSQGFSQDGSCERLGRGGGGVHADVSVALDDPVGTGPGSFFSRPSNQIVFTGKRLSF